MKKLCIALVLIMSACLLFAGCDAPAEAQTDITHTMPNTEFTTQDTTESTYIFVNPYTAPSTEPVHIHDFLDGSCTTCGEKDPNFGDITYVLNVKSMKFHYLSCKTLPTENRQDTTMSREEIIAAGYSPCNNCDP